MTKEEFSEWFEKALPGDSIIYHRGFLAQDAQGQSKEAKAFKVFSQHVLGYNDSRDVHLVQKKVLPTHEIVKKYGIRRAFFEYFAVKI